MDDGDETHLDVTVDSYFQLNGLVLAQRVHEDHLPSLLAGRDVVDGQDPATNPDLKHSSLS